MSVKHYARWTIRSRISGIRHPHEQQLRMVPCRHWPARWDSCHAFCVRPINSGFFGRDLTSKLSGGPVGQPLMMRLRQLPDERRHVLHVFEAQQLIEHLVPTLGRPIAVSDHPIAFLQPSRPFSGVSAAGFSGGGRRRRWLMGSWPARGGRRGRGERVALRRQGH